MVRFEADQTELIPATILDWLTGNKSEGDIPDTAGFNWVDVRDGM